MALASGVVIYLLETQSIDLPLFILGDFPGSEKAQYRRAVDSLMPKITFVSKFSIQMAFLFAYQVSFSD